jgi:hypothetical protein
MSKKKKKGIEKRRAKARERKKKKRVLRHIKHRQQPQVITRPGLPHMGAPEGFRSISMSQAMMEYAKPVLKFFEDDEKSYNNALQISMGLWNYALSVEKGDEDKKIGKDLLKAMGKALRLDKDKAQSLFTKMIERRAYLFPQDIQPEPNTPFMFIRKEIRYLIQPFDYRKLIISDGVEPPDQKDRDLIEKINRLDELIHDGEDYAKYENLFYSLKDECQDLFERWLVAKGLEDDVQDYSFCLQTYLDFIYSYMHDDVVVLKSVPNIYFVEFFEDFLLRKMMVEPNEYIYWPPALKLFYHFLHEKGYLDNQDNFIATIDKVEPYFIEILKKQFS